jgi:hypothetical protein
VYRLLKSVKISISTDRHVNNEFITGSVTLINCRVLPKGNKHSKLSYFLLILSKNKENVTFTWAAVVQNVLFLTITGDKFVIYVPIRRYGDFNTLQQPVHPSAAPWDVLGYFRMLKSPYLRIGT